MPYLPRRWRAGRALRAPTLPDSRVTAAAARRQAGDRHRQWGQPGDGASCARRPPGEGKSSGSAVGRAWRGGAMPRKTATSLPDLT